MNDTVILTFTYPLIEPYFEDFLKSCETQTNKEFDIIIVNDGLTSLQSMIDCHPRKIFYPSMRLLPMSLIWLI